MKIYSKAHEKALKLKREMDQIEKEHTTFLNKAEKMQTKMNTSLKRNNFNRLFDSIEKEFNEKEDEAYAKYYNHMHKSLSLQPKDNTFLKYKEGFADEKYINDMFKQKAKQQKKVQHGHKQVKRKSR